jgi:UDP-glucose 4-epimerase
MSNGKILVVGGAGYIGSHTNMVLAERGHETIVFDNLVYGHSEFVQWGTLIEGDLSDEASIDGVFQNNDIDAVVHFAAYAFVGESVADPEKYYTNNVANTLKLLKSMVKHNVKTIVFSSTCATYGPPEYTPIDEAHDQNPINPYGQTKLMVETIMKDFSHAYGLQYATLRYFNAAGADPEGRIGEWHDPETHLIPLVLDAAMDANKSIKIFGTDYDTPDGTCIRDYIHVLDLADAHIRVLDYLKGGGASAAFNLGYGSGYSVREVIEAAREVTGCDIKAIETDRREGDPSILVGDAAKAKEILGWNPVHSEIATIIEHAWTWHQKTKS